MAKILIWIYVGISLLNAVVGYVFFDAVKPIGNINLFWGLIGVLAICESIESRNEEYTN